LPPPPQDVLVTARGRVYLETQISGAAVESAVVRANGEDLATVTVKPASPVELPVGISTATVTVSGCTDSICSGRIPGSSQEIAVTYEKKEGGLSVTPQSLSFSQPFGGEAPASKQVMLRELGDASLAWSSMLGDEAAADWLSVTPAEGATLPATATLTVTPRPAAGEYRARLHFLLGTTVSVPVDVTYAIVADFHAEPEVFNVVGQAGAPTPEQTLSLSDSTGGSYPWRITLEYDAAETEDFATLSADSGESLPAEVTLSFGDVPDRLSHFCSLRIRAAGLEKRIPITYRKP
jgi:hypothetical protein